MHDWICAACYCHRSWIQFSSSFAALQAAKVRENGSCNTTFPTDFFQHAVLGSRWILVFSFCEARLETHQRDFSGACGSVAVGSATICKVPQLRRHIRFCKRARAVRANSLSARRTTNWGLTGEQHDTNLTNWGKQPQSSAFNTSLELLMLAWLGEGCVDGW